MAFVFEEVAAATVDAVVTAEGQRSLSDVDFPDPAEDKPVEG